jgi:hypothetical protein
MAPKSPFLGAGLVGVFGTTIKCEATDNSLFCNIMKLLNVIIAFFIIICIFYTIYTYASPFLKKGRK